MKEQTNLIDALIEQGLQGGYVDVEKYVNDQLESMHCEDPDFLIYS